MTGKETRSGEVLKIRLFDAVNADYDFIVISGLENTSVDKRSWKIRTWVVSLRGWSRFLLNREVTIKIIDSENNPEYFL